MWMCFQCPGVPSSMPGQVEVYTGVDELPAVRLSALASQLLLSPPAPPPLAVAEAWLTLACKALLVHACCCGPMVWLRALTLRAHVVGRSPVRGAQRTLGVCDRFRLGVFKMSHTRNGSSADVWQGADQREPACRGRHQRAVCRRPASRGF